MRRGREGGRDGIGGGGGPAAVDDVGDDGVAQVGEVDADLVGAPREQLQLLHTHTPRAAWGADNTRGTLARGSGIGQARAPWAMTRGCRAGASAPAVAALGLAALVCR